MADIHIVASGTKKSLRPAGTNLWLLQEIFPRPCTTQNRTENTFRLLWRNLLVQVKKSLRLIFEKFLGRELMGTLWNYFGFHQEGVCSEENSLWKTGWNAHVAPSTLKFRHRDVYNGPLAELGPKPPIQDKYTVLPISVKNQWEVQWAPSMGLSATASHWASLGLGWREGWNTELHGARSAVVQVAWHQTHPDLHPNHIQFQSCNLAKFCWRVHKL